MDYSRYECLKIEKADRVATVTLNRPETGNRIEHRFHVELQDIWADLARDKEVNAILLTGSGKYFSVGGNVKGMQDRPGGDVFEEGEMLEPSGGRRIVQNILDCEQPIVCAINGDCIGLAATVALLCDITVASRTARIADPHVKIGLVAGDGGAVIWPMLVGPNRAKEFLMRGNLIDAVDAERMGLVNYALPQEQVLPKARELAQELADGAPWAIRWTKLAVNKAIKDQFNLIMDASYALEMCTFQTSDHREAVRAFVEKRKPRFTGR
ncbi:MAG: enoyl-CoA hydratase/isomerase family protein [Burkholderiales bacterium]|nr:enoyl-CoA hydratase/isomerase family protein [Burkholderiales bacterium]OJX03424.1 MAG: enoyl-CoA hydratase [Burkholderiales bacterium 70-64]